MTKLSTVLFAGLDRLAELMAFIAGAAVLMLALLITVDVLARKLMGFSLQGTDEVGGYVLAMVGSIGMAHVLSRREFTRIDLLFRFLPVAVRRMLHVLAYLALAGVVVFFARSAIMTLDETFLFQTRTNTPLQTPMWIPQGLWAFGMTFFACMAVLHALRALLLLLVKPEVIDFDYGVTRPEEDVEAYVGGPHTAPDRTDRKNRT